MIDPIHNLIIQPSAPAFYDKESVTAIRAMANLQGKMNEVIEGLNALEENVIKEMADFKASSDQDQEIFESALRQEFQDFIDTVTLKLAGYDGSLTDFEALITRKTIETFNEAVSNGYIEVKSVYNEETESLDYILYAGRM